MPEGKERNQASQSEAFNERLEGYKDGLTSETSKAFVEQLREQFSSGQLSAEYKPEETGDVWIKKYKGLYYVTEGIRNPGWVIRVGDRGEQKGVGGFVEGHDTAIFVRIPKEKVLELLD